jgi:AcrR family transcriptional regulator
MVEVAAERGYAGATVGLLVAHAGVSRRTFYECFDGREACVLALLDLGLERVGDLVGSAVDGDPAPRQIPADRLREHLHWAVELTESPSAT